MNTDPADDIAAALARLRGGRPRPPWDRGRNTWGAGPHAGGGPHGGGPHGMPPWMGAHRGPGLGRLRLLEALAAASHALSISEAADAIGVDQPRASRLVQQVVEAGLARREPDPEDARRARVALTDAGVALVRSFRGERRAAVDTALAGFTEDERVELARLLAKLADAWPHA